ncbi:MAG: glycosyltransferase involved in cell wall biosynthesis [Saprospiraceae bacterium]|jgi:glycosyltransferase involved in cell wall biosynthesis
MERINFDVLSVIVPLYNEEKTIESILQKLLNVKLDYGITMEILIIDDCSTDTSIRRVRDFITAHRDDSISLISHERNRGKGAAIHAGIEKSTGQFIIVQDADLEYDPNDFNDMLAPIIQGHADIVYGSRFIGSKPHRMLFFWHSIGNKILTLLCNFFSNLNLSDMETCYKLIKREYLLSMNLKEKRFGFEPEVTIKLSRIPTVKFYEVGIAYYGRTFSDGKKINYKDGFRAIYCIFKYGLFRNL